MENQVHSLELISFLLNLVFNVIIPLLFLLLIVFSHFQLHLIKAFISLSPKLYLFCISLSLHFIAVSLYFTSFQLKTYLTLENIPYLLTKALSLRACKSNCIYSLNRNQEAKCHCRLFVFNSEQKTK